MQEAGVKLQTYGNNLLKLVNHTGKHNDPYHEQVGKILDTYYSKLHQGQYENAKQALDSAMDYIEKQISSGKLPLYNNKDVWIPK